MDDEMLETFPQHTCTWLKGTLTLYKYQNYWTTKHFLEGGILAQQNFKAEPTDIFLCSCPKTGTTWLKALAFAIVTRNKFNKSTTPLLTSSPHDCVPFIEKSFFIDGNKPKDSNFPLVATHLPYLSLPESVISSNCKIVYIYRNTKDAIVSHYHFLRKAFEVSQEDAPFDMAFDEFCQGISAYGPYWDHILGYWKAKLERPENVLILKYEDMKSDIITYVKKLAEFMGYPFSIEEDKKGVVDDIIKLCSFENLCNLDVNKTGRSKFCSEVENRLFLRKAKDGDWEKYFTDEMKEKIDKLMDEKLSGTGLVLK
ncbi:flavonol sulfotransferase-like [Rutidosis leptorrhynchoides]|uniref:flavonol sulfotransferase-like n=1 Tax=Rutidosis leptorrhynchoides TaxID=125765 RepID=UPI003A9A121D